MSLTVTPIANQVATSDAQNPVLDGNGQPVTQTAGFIGISSATPIVYNPTSRSPPSPESSGEGLWRPQVPSSGSQKMVGVW